MCCYYAVYAQRTSIYDRMAGNCASCRLWLLTPPPNNWRTGLFSPLTKHIPSYERGRMYIELTNSNFVMLKYFKSVRLFLVSQKWLIDGGALLREESCPLFG